MPAKDQAAYMREYRAKKKAQPFLKPAMEKAIRESVTPEKLMEAWKRSNEKDERIAELEAEVIRLNKALVDLPYLEAENRSAISQLNDSFRTFRPAPKPGHRQPR